jgi:hypothetical protein
LRENLSEVAGGSGPALSSGEVLIASNRAGGAA